MCNVQQESKRIQTQSKETDRQTDTLSQFQGSLCIRLIVV